VGSLPPNNPPPARHRPGARSARRMRFLADLTRMIMSRSIKLWTVALTSALAVGYVLPRPGSQDGDILDAVAAVQRHSPKFLISAPNPRANWANSGALYLCRTHKTAIEVESLPKDPRLTDSAWKGVVCFIGTDDPNLYDHPWISEGGDRCLRFGRFAVFGDADMLQEVHEILVSAGFRRLR
jgi:hypothetical protein